MVGIIFAVGCLFFLWRYAMTSIQMDPKFEDEYQAYLKKQADEWGPKVSRAEVSPDAQKQVFVRDNPIKEERQIILKVGETEKVLDTVNGVLVSVGKWSPDSRFITYAEGTSSLGYTNSVIDTETGKIAFIEDTEAFAEEVRGHDSYSHVYSYPLEWRNNDELIMGVSGISDYGRDKDLKMYFLVNAHTGKVIKRIL